MSPDLDLWCLDLEDSTQQMRVRPGRAEMHVPFELTGVEFRLHGLVLTPRLRVVAYEPETAPEGNLCLVIPHARRATALRRGTTYMAVLEELVAATDLEGVPPTSEEICERLTRRGLPVTRKAVDRHIDYLGERLLPEDHMTIHRGWKRAALAAIARRARLVDVSEAGT